MSISQQDLSKSKIPSIKQTVPALVTNHQKNTNQHQNNNQRIECNHFVKTAQILPS
jgi:hypothetical protein